MPKSNFGLGFKDGLQVRGLALNVHQKGQVLYVCNSSVVAKFGISGANDSDGLTPERPLSTIAAALALSTANRGDKIVVLPGHAEAVSAAAGLDINVAGIEIIGIGEGAVRPTITLNTANTATVRISANDVKVSNILFVANFLNIATCIVLTTAKDTQIIDCEFKDTSAVLNFVKAVVTSAVAVNTNDGLTIKGCTMRGTGTSAATCLVNVLEALDRLTVEDNNVLVQGTTATTGVLILATSKALTSLVCARNIAQSLYTGSAGCLIVGTTGSTGIVRDNFITIAGGGTDLLATASTGLGFCNNYIQSAADKSGALMPALE